jgi:Protein of unknown function (DUF1254)
VLERRWHGRRDGGGDAPTDGAASEQPTDVELATRTYVAGYPPVVSVRTLQRLGGLVGVNRLFWQNDLAGPQSRTIVAPNRDTVYSIAVLDLRAEPMVLTLPEVTDRYFTYQFLGAWTESFAYVGTRATRGRAGTWVINPPGWDGELPAGADRIEATTPQVFLLGRFLVDDQADIANVTAISRQTSLRPLSALTGAPAAPPPPPLGEPLGTPQDIPADASFFDELGDALAVNPPTTAAQRELFARAEALGIGPDAHPTDATRSTDGESGGPDEPGVLDEGAATGYEQIVDEAMAIGRTADGWSANLHIGRYGDDMLLRAARRPGRLGCEHRRRGRVPRGASRRRGRRPRRKHDLSHHLPRGGAAAGRGVLVAFGVRRRHVLHRVPERPLHDRRPHPWPHVRGRRLARARPVPRRAPHGRRRATRQLASGAGGAVRADAPALPSGRRVLEGDYRYPAVRRIASD